VIGRGHLHSLAAVRVSLNVSQRKLCIGYLAGRSSVLRARPGCYVSCVWWSMWVAVLTSSSVWIPAEFWADCRQR
jgi:hypothetical protein